MVLTIALFRDRASRNPRSSCQQCSTRHRDLDRKSRMISLVRGSDEPSSAMITSTDRLDRSIDPPSMSRHDWSCAPPLNVASTTLRSNVYPFATWRTRTSCESNGSPSNIPIRVEHARNEVANSLREHAAFVSTQEPLDLHRTIFGGPCPPFKRTSNRLTDGFRIAWLA